MVKKLILILPIIGIILLKANYTSADLKDEVSINANTLKATSLSLSIQDTIDNSTKPYAFNLNRFQKDSLSVTSIRIRNTGIESTKYFLQIKLLNDNETCKSPILKILKDDKIIYNDNINNLNLEMDQLIKNDKNDLIFLLSLNQNNTIVNTLCDYQLEISTKLNPLPKQGLFDNKKINNQIQFINN